MKGLGKSASLQTCKEWNNLTAASMLQRYSVYRRVVDYYSDNPTVGRSGEDAFDMRKPLSKDKAQQHTRKNGRDVRVHPEDIYHG